MPRLLRDLGTSTCGLSVREAARRLERYGPNTLRRAGRATLAYQHDSGTAYVALSGQAELIDERGIVTWSVELPPLGRRAVTLEYRVKSQRGRPPSGSGRASPRGETR